jgi:2-polyprenyl-3-methyl-5-hydroxy-6-metoxy-1,4-benzoquinol methylase
MKDNEGVDVRESRYCFLCGCEGTLLYSGMRDRLFGASGIWTLVQCPGCQLVWLNPQPTPNNIEKLYSQYFTHQTFNAKKNALTGLRKSMKASILQSSYGYQIDGSNKVMGSVLSYIGPLREMAGRSVRWLEAHKKGCLLDIGCGNGLFLDQMRHFGWDVAGVEPDGKAVSVAREKFGLEVFQGSLEGARFADGRFDAITMSHVIEHVPDPIGLLKECRRVLKPGGRLVIVTPNIKSMGRRVFGDAWLHWDPPRHLFLFSPQALRACAEAARMNVSEMRTTASSAPSMWAASSLIRQDGQLPGGSPKEMDLMMRMRGLGFLAREHGLSGSQDAGEEIVMVVER